MKIIASTTLTFIVMFQCSEGSILHHHTSQSIPILDLSCDHNIDCPLNAICEPYVKKCKCIEGHSYTNGSCELDFPFITFLVCTICGVLVLCCFVCLIKCCCKYDID